MTEHLDAEKSFEDLQARISYLRKIADQLNINDDKFFDFAQTVIEKADKSVENLENSFRDLLEYMEGVSYEYKKTLSYFQKTIKKTKKVLAKKIEGYEEVGGFNLIDHVQKKSEGTPAGNIEGNKLDIMEKLETLFNDLHYTYVILMAEAPLKWITSIIPTLLDELSTVSLDSEKGKRVNRNLQKAQYYLEKIRDEFPSIDVTGLRPYIEGLCDLIPKLNEPAQRPENVALNRLIAITADWFLANGFSERRAFRETGALMLKHGFLENSEHLSSRIRHRYKRSKNKTLPS